MKSYLLRTGILAVGLLASSMCSAASYFQFCGSGSTALACEKSQSLDTTYTDESAYKVMKSAGCTLTESKISMASSNVGVDTYKCPSGDFQGASFQVFYTTKGVNVIVMY